MSSGSDRHDGFTIPARAGVGLKAEHYQHILTSAPDVGFFEIHAENYMGAGGPPHRYLASIRELYPLSLHGVGLSIGATQPIDENHLQKLGELIRRYRPGLFSEHLAWSTHETTFLNDLLPAPYTSETLARVSEHIDQVQTVLGSQMLLENPSSYVWLAESTWSETSFIAEIVRRTGCGLLLDVNNIHVSCTNQQWNAEHYIDDFPLSHVQEIHLAGHEREIDEKGRPLLIDTHDKSVDEVVWNLFRRVIKRLGPVPTLIEWDTKVPSWPTLHGEAVMADILMGVSTVEELRYDAVG